MFKENNDNVNEYENSQKLRRFRNISWFIGRSAGSTQPFRGRVLLSLHSCQNPQFGMTINNSSNDKKDIKNVKNFVPVCLNAPVSTKKKVAFTLAEVLITLGIIGIVVAMTIPTLMTNIKAKKLRTQFLKSYSIVQQAFKLMENDDVSSDPTTYGYGEYYKTFLNYVKGGMDCGNTSSNPMKSSVPCYQMYKGAKHYKSLDKKATFRYQFLDDGQIVLPDGTLLLFENYAHSVNDILAVSVDINGYGNPPNVAGYDLFTFQLVDGELKTMGDKSTAYNELDKYCNPNVSNNMNGVACAQKAKENPDYFKEIVKEFK